MSHGRDVIVEQPIFTCHAQVFYTNYPTTGKWTPASSTWVAVNFFVEYESSRHLYRIKSVEGNKVLINSTILPDMEFTQTSKRFGQWSDVSSGLKVIYGVGLASEAELMKFAEKFREVKELATKSSPNSATKFPRKSALYIVSEESSNEEVERAATKFPRKSATYIVSDETNPANIDIKKEASSSRSQRDRIEEVKEAAKKSPRKSATFIVSEETNPANIDIKKEASSSRRQRDRIEEVEEAAKKFPRKSTTFIVSEETNPANIEIKKEASSSLSDPRDEIERLNLALAKSCEDAKKQEVELAKLKSKNQQLESALQESTADVDKWKVQSRTYKEANSRLEHEIRRMKFHILSLEKDKAKSK